jgi:periplasmic protein TonB
VKWTAFKLSWCASLIVHGVIIATAVVVHHRHATVTIGENGDAGIEIIIGATRASESPSISPAAAQAQKSVAESEVESYSAAEETAPPRESFPSPVVIEFSPEELPASVENLDSDWRVSISESERRDSDEQNEIIQDASFRASNVPSEVEFKNHTTTQSAKSITQSWESHLNNPKVIYPKEARRRKQQGSVLLTVSISAAGLPEEIRVKQSSGFQLLDNSALEAVRKWRFIPSTMGNVDTASEMELPIHFKLTD